MIRHENQMKTEVREKMRGGAGTVSIRHFFGKDEFEAAVRLCARLVIPPGAGIGPHTHETEDEVYIVLSGQGALDDGQDEAPVNPGDAVLTGKGQSHAIRNTGRGDLVLIAFISCYQ